MPITHQRPDAADATAGIYYGSGGIRRAERQKRPEEGAKGGHRADHRSSILCWRECFPWAKRRASPLPSSLPPWSLAELSSVWPKKAEKTSGTHLVLLCHDYNTHRRAGVGLESCRAIASIASASIQGWIHWFRYTYATIRSGGVPYICICLVFA